MSKRLIRNIFASICLLMLAGLNASCVHEWPDPAAHRAVELTISHSLEWNYLEHLVNVRSRGDADESTRSSMETVRYIYRVYPKGNQTDLIAEYIRYSPDVLRTDFTTYFDLPVGDWEIHIWSDYVDDITKQSDFYITDHFGRITLADEYIGHNERKDAFRGIATVSVPESIDNDVAVSASVTLERPLASYAFVANDLREFVVMETTRWDMLTKAEEEEKRRLYIEEALAQGMTQEEAERFAASKITAERDNSQPLGDPAQAPGDPAPPSDTPPADAPAKIPDYKDYTVTMYYTGFLPSVFNHFTNKPIDSRTGQFYTATISELSETDALLAFDHVFVNGRESSVKVMLEVKDPRGNVIAGSQPIDVPIVRGRCTVVKGEFLTSKTTGGVGIVPDFDGDFNIPLN